VRHCFILPALPHPTPPTYSNIGRTWDINLPIGAPEGTIFFLQRVCLDAHAMEQRIKQKAAQLFKKRSDYGNDYFEGDLQSL